jgi:tetratricopeptide (TPR) repeat protein
MTGRHRRIRTAGLLLLALTIAASAFSGCASSSKVNDAPVQDQLLVRYNRSALQAFESGRFEQAAGFYRKALGRAYIRDDLEAIVDAHYNLAICLTNQQAYEEALDAVKQAETELALRNRGVQIDLQLLEATLHYYLKDADSAHAVTAEILAADPEAPAQIRSKTFYLRGLIAAQRGDTQELRETIAFLGEPVLPQLLADRYELEGRLAMAEKSWRTAIGAFDTAADLRREDLDYGKMIEALALAARACERAGDLPQASNRYLRAGISAALQGEHRKARTWLERAERFAVAGGDSLAAGRARQHLEKLPGD